MGTNILLPENAVAVYRGMSKTFELTVKDATGAAIDLTGSSIYFTVKKSLKDPLPLIQKSAVSALQIELTAPRSGGASIYLDPSDTQSMDSGNYVFDVIAILANGKRYVVIPPSVFIIESTVTSVPI